MKIEKNMKERREIRDGSIWYSIIKVFLKQRFNPILIGVELEGLTGGGRMGLLLWTKL